MRLNIGKNQKSISVNHVVEHWIYTLQSIYILSIEPMYVSTLDKTGNTVFAVGACQAVV